MRFEEEDIAKMVKVNNIMRTINREVDNIYDALMDEEPEELLTHIKKLSSVLKKLTKNYKP
tara:strand:+ start:1854 stop:2036 length:183 start_codon:yes stop_codon:yes gene_type:complete